MSVRYRDFIDAADTISAMGNSARTIIGTYFASPVALLPTGSQRRSLTHGSVMPADTAGELGEACSQMVGGSWRERQPPKKEHETAAVAKDVLTVLQAPEHIAASLEECQYVAAAVHLISARKRYEALQQSSSPATREWLAVPFVRLRARTLMDEAQAVSIVNATRCMLGTQVAHAPRADSGHAEASALVADAVGASVLVQGLSLRDALETFLEARSAAIRDICQKISSAAPEVGSPGSADDGDECVEAMEALLRQACLAVVETVCQALELFCSVKPCREGDVTAPSSARPPLLVTLLSGLSGMPIRRDMQTAVEESECSTAVRGWLLAMSAAVNAATAAALHRVRAGKVLAVLELALRKIDEEVLGRDGSRGIGRSGAGGTEVCGPCSLWEKVSLTSPWATLFAAAFLKRSKEVLAARFSGKCESE